MSGEPHAKMKSTFIPAPIDGLNLRVAPHQLKPTEARALTNYYVFDWGIREGGNTTAMSQTLDSIARQMISYEDGNGSPFMLTCTDTKVWHTNSAGTIQQADVTGALTITTGIWQYCQFGMRLFLLNGTDVGLVYNINAGTLANDGWTGPTPNSSVLNQCWNYKNRFYAIQETSRSYWYGGVNSITGALTEVDLSQVLFTSGSLLFGTSWSVNQGLENEELFVVVTTVGEVLIYSGDYPAASNWQLINRVVIPRPVGNRAFIRVGQDVLICTARGLISLRQVISSRVEDAVYYSVSSKLADEFSVRNVTPILDPRQPFIYFAASTSQLFVLNYERGAWSVITLPNGLVIHSMAFFENGTAGQYLFIGGFDSAIRIRRLDDSTGNSVSHLWYTGWLDLGSVLQKQMRHMRVLGRNVAGDNDFINTVSMNADFTDPASPLQDTRTTAVSVDVYNSQQLNPPGAGARLSAAFSKTSAGEQNEIAGFDLFYTEGGVH